MTATSLIRITEQKEKNKKTNDSPKSSRSREYFLDETCRQFLRRSSDDCLAWHSDLMMQLQDKKERRDVNEGAYGSSSCSLDAE